MSRRLVILPIDGPAAPTCQTFSWNGNANGTSGTVQTFTVPADVTSVTITANGAQGGASGGNGGRVEAVGVPVTPGEELYVYVGGSPSGQTGAWPDAGPGGVKSTSGYSGGGSSQVRRTPYALGNALVIAGGGGGASASATGGYPNGGDGVGNGHAYGGTQSAGGAYGTYLGSSGTAGSAGQGGQGWEPGGGFGVGGHGGGGGYYGGGGGGETGPGGGGSSYESGTAASVTYDNGANTGHGEVTICWEA